MEEKKMGTGGDMFVSSKGKGDEGGSGNEGENFIRGGCVQPSISRNSHALI
jgi:hypothetical protein